ncbi:MAG TPA: hypothetical protein DCO72_11275 [Ruminococcus sp.]|nr:hypothetical protein [Ruminococcus sp.]
MELLEILAEVIGRFNKGLDNLADSWERKMDRAEYQYDHGQISFEEYSSIMTQGIDYLSKYNQHKASQYRQKYHR